MFNMPYKDDGGDLFAFFVRGGPEVAAVACTLLQPLEMLG